jgi:glucokinase
MKPVGLLVLESGGTKLLAGISDAQGTLLHTVRAVRQSSNTAADTLKQLVEMARDLQCKGQAEGYELAACGFGFGGSVARSTQAPYLSLHEDGWGTIDGRAFLQKELQMPVFVENDCKVAALAEAVLGAGADARTVFYMTVGTGIGGGFVRDGRILALADTGEAEVGHLPLEPGGPACGCGGRGCLEALAAGPAILASAKGAFASTEQIFAAWSGGDVEATIIVERAAGYVARGIACVMALYHPECIVMGGGVASGSRRFVDRVAELSAECTVPYFRDDLEIRPAALGEHVVIQGAAMFALSQVSISAQTILPEAL